MILEVFSAINDSMNSLARKELRSMKDWQTVHVIFLYGFFNSYNKWCFVVFYILDYFKSKHFRALYICFFQCQQKRIIMAAVQCILAVFQTCGCHDVTGRVLFSG